MPYPEEYRRANEDFKDFLTAVKRHTGLGTSNMSYTVAEGVFRAFRRRLTVPQALGFASRLPAGLRALFVADWDSGEPHVQGTVASNLAAEVKSLRPDHNFANLCDDPVAEVGLALEDVIGRDRFYAALAGLPEEATRFWQR